MRPELDLLYRNAMEHFNDTLRFLDSDELGHYQECTAALSRQEKEMASILGQERLEKYNSVQDEKDHFLQQAIFRRGLALGLRLSALAIS